MRIRLFLVLMIFFLVRMALPADVPLAWDASATPTVTGYKIFVGAQSKVYGSPITIGNVTTYTVTGLAAGSHCFAATAFDAAGNESDFSNEVCTVIDSLVATVTINLTFGPSISQLLVTALSTNYATIAWVTNADCSGIILYGTDPTRLVALATNNLGTTDHLGVINGLVTRTHYVYKAQSVCGGKTIESDMRSFNSK